METNQENGAPNGAESGRVEILKMLEEKKITVEEAMQLLQALKVPVAAQPDPAPRPAPTWDRYADDHERQTPRRRFNLSGANLASANLQGAKLEGANLF